VPVYPATEKLPARRIRELVDRARPWARAAPERLPAWIRERLALPGAADAKIRALFGRSDVHTIHAHAATYGCFLARIERN
jgi:hypothetical protein